MTEIPTSHPRYDSLMGRKLLTDAARDGLLADSALIAHGRGEAFDYLLGEQTCASARKAIKHASAILLEAERPIISVNGNTVALAADDLIRCAAIIQCDIEVNIYYRTLERMNALLGRLSERKQAILEQPIPDGWNSGAERVAQDWFERVQRVELLGANPDTKIPNLEGPRANCCANGIMGADVVFVPLEDGDRCEALVAAGKRVIVVDLNPLSRTAKMASVTIVDELRRVVKLLFEDLLLSTEEVDDKWDNQANLDSVMSEIVFSFKE